MEVKMPLNKNFIEMWKNVEHTYLGKPVPPKYQSQYGKKYDKKETKQIAFAIANKRGIKTD